MRACCSTIWNVLFLAQGLSFCHWCFGMLVFSSQVDANTVWQMPP